MIDINSIIAAATQYKPMTDLPFLKTWSPGQEYMGSTTEVFNQLFTLSIRIGAMLAVLMFIWGGLQMITARDSADSVGKGKEKMTNAIMGLLMLISTFVVLNTINPQLVSLSFLTNITRIEGKAPTQAPIALPYTPSIENDYCYRISILGQQDRIGPGRRCYKTLQDCKLNEGNSVNSPLGSACFDQRAEDKKNIASNTKPLTIINKYDSMIGDQLFCYKNDTPCYNSQAECSKDPDYQNKQSLGGTSCKPVGKSKTTSRRDGRFKLNDDSGNTVAAYDFKELCDAYAIQKTQETSGTYTCQ